MKLFPLVHTKLNPPRVVGDLIERPRLMERLNRGVNRKLTLIVAPAGYGKSTLASEWLARCRQPFAWVSLEPQDSEWRLFLRYFVAAVESLFPHAVPLASALLQSPELPPSRVLVDTLINELNGIDQPFILALDDYHFIRDMAIHDFIDELLTHTPRGLHLVLITRLNPPLNLRLLRARGHLLELRAEDLRFTIDETQAFAQKAYGKPLDAQQAAVLQEKVEGWAVGLHLCFLSLQDPGELDAIVERFSDQRLVIDYLFNEVFLRQPEFIRERLLKTAILDRFSASLCDSLCEADASSSAMSGREFIQWLEQADVFVFALDREHEWFRYHHLFQDLLRHQLAQTLDADEIATLHRRASRWFAENGFIDEAIHHALKADDVDAAADLVAQHRRDILNADQWHVLKRWLSYLPDEVKQNRAELLLAQAWVAYYAFQLWRISPLLDAMEALLEDAPASDGLRGEINFFRGHSWFWRGDMTRSVEFLDQALQQMPRSYQQGWGEAAVFWGLAGLMNGRKEDVIRSLTQWLYYDQKPPTLLMTRLLGTLIFVHILSGNLHEAERLALELHEGGVTHGSAYTTRWASYLLGYIRYFWNDLEPAARYFETAVEGRHILHKRAAVDALAGLALTYQALRRLQDVEKTLQTFLEFTRTTRDPADVAVARSCQAHAALLQGDRQVAMQWLQTADLSTDGGVMFFWLETPRVTQCRALIAQGTHDSLQKAKTRLTEHRRMAENTHNIRQLIDLLALEALLYEKQAQTEQALTLLQRALTLARPGGWIRPFVELGPDMAMLLNELAKQIETRDFVAHILRSFSATRPASLPDQTVLFEPLTDREIDVLTLLARRYSNKEIAAELFIAPTTVKRHASNIYQKLGVKNRRQAVEKAIALGILPSSATHERII